MRKRAPLYYDASRAFPWYVDLPTYCVVDGGARPLAPGLIGPDGPLSGVDAAAVLALAPTVEIEIPSSHFNRDGTLNRGALRAMYPARCGDGWTPPALGAVS